MGSYFLSSSALHPTTNMKFLVLAACADHLATKFGAGLGYAGYAPGYAAGYGYAGYGAGYGYAGLGYAAAAPLVVAAPVATGYAGYGTGYGYAAAAPLATGYAGYAPAYAGAYGYAGPLTLNTQLIAHPNGAVVPLDEPAVAAARAAHLDTQAAEYAASAPVIAAPVVAALPAVAAAPVAAVGYGYAGPLNLNTQLVAHPNGAVVPLDEPAVAA